MLTTNLIILFVAILLLLGIASSKFSARLGMPMLLLFLGIGMLAGSEGIGRIPFEDYGLANSIGSVALALILFDGGLRTSYASVRRGWQPALVLATFGVLVTSLLTGLAAMWILGLPLLHSLLLGSIISSTDAATVFSVLRTSGLRLPDRLTATLELESGSNDPMAVFLTVGLTALLAGTADSPLALLMLFLLQFGIGALVGVAIGAVAAWSLSRINLSYPGLYPLFVMAFGLLAFGLTAVLDGSGFLAVYLAGIVFGNRSTIFRNGIYFFHDAAAWLSQIVLFVLLGLLSFPSRLWEVALVGLLVAAVLLLVARPLTVWLSLRWFHFPRRELLFLSWVGLKGAVPITLATFPLLAGVPQSERLFNVVFFVVLISALTQGWSLPVIARWLKLGTPANPVPPLSVEINALRQIDSEIVDYTVSDAARIGGRQLREVALPAGVVVTLLLRDNELIMPRGATYFRTGDHVFIAVRRQLKPLVDRLFLPAAEQSPAPVDCAVAFHDTDTVAQVATFFGLEQLPEPEATLGTLLARQADGAAGVVGPFQLAPGRADHLVELYHSHT